MHDQLKLLANLLKDFERGGGRSLAGARVFDKHQDLLGELVSLVGASFARQQTGQALSFEGALSLIKSRARTPERVGCAADGLSVDMNPTQHFVFDLERVAGIEEVVLCKEGVGNVLRMGMESAGLA